MIAIDAKEAFGLPTGVKVAKAPTANGVVGAVIGLESLGAPTYERSEEPVVALKVAWYSPEGDALPPLLVEVRGEDPDDSISVGDWIQLPAAWTPGLPVSRVMNLTTGTTVRLHRETSAGVYGAIVTLLAAAAVIAYFAASAVGL